MLLQSGSEELDLALCILGAWTLLVSIHVLADTALPFNGFITADARPLVEECSAISRRGGRYVDSAGGLTHRNPMHDQ